MRKDRVVATYGRHRQRVVAVETWSTHDRVFSSSSDSFRSQPDNSVDHHDRSVFNSPCNKENESDISWLQEKENGRFARKKKIGNTRATRKKQYTVPQNDSSVDSSNQSRDQVGGGNRRRTTRAVLRDVTSKLERTKIDPTQNKTRPLRSARKLNAAVGKLNTKNKPVTKAPAKTKADSSSGIIEISSTYNFSDIDQYSLLISDSPPLEVAAVLTPAIETRVTEGGPAGRSDRLTSTPAQEKCSAVGELRKSLLSHLHQAKNKSGSLNNGSFGTRRKMRAKVTRSTPKGASAGVPVVHSSTPVDRKTVSLRSLEESGAMESCDDVTDDVMQCSVVLDHLHLSTVSSIATSPNMSDFSKGESSLHKSPGLHLSERERAVAVNECRVNLTRLSSNGIKMLASAKQHHSQGTAIDRSSSYQRYLNISRESFHGRSPSFHQRGSTNVKCNSSSDQYKRGSSSIGFAISSEANHSVDSGSDQYDTCQSSFEKRSSTESNQSLKLKIINALKVPPSNRRATYVIKQPTSGDKTKSDLCHYNHHHHHRRDFLHESYDASKSLFDTTNDGRSTHGYSLRNRSNKLDASATGCFLDKAKQSFQSLVDDLNDSSKAANRSINSGVGESEDGIADDSRRQSRDEEASSSGKEDDEALSEIAEDSDEEDIRYSLNVEAQASPQDTIHYTADQHGSQDSHSITNNQSIRSYTWQNSRLNHGHPPRPQPSKQNTRYSHISITSSILESDTSKSDSNMVHISHSDRATDRSKIVHHKNHFSSVSENSMSSQYEEAESRLSVISIHSDDATENSSRSSAEDDASRFSQNDVEDEMTTSQLIESADETDENEGAEASGSDYEASDDESEYESDSNGSEVEEIEDESAMDHATEHGERGLQNISEASMEESSVADESAEESSVVVESDEESSASDESHSVDSEVDVTEEEDSENVSRYEIVDEHKDRVDTAVIASYQNESKVSKTDVTKKGKENKFQGKCNAEFKTPVRSTRQSAIPNELCNSFKVLTPVRMSRGEEVLSARDKVLLKCEQVEPMPFSKCFTPTMLRKCVKIGEGVYGEVFKTERSKKSVALKIVPIEGDFAVNDEPQKTYAEMLPEIVISKELSDLRHGRDNMTSAFVDVRGVSVVCGKYPAPLLKQWDAFHNRKGSENDRPDMFGAEQLYIVFEFEECGCDLEGFQFTSLAQAKSTLQQVALALAVGEAAFQLEHRDLHWGNVLVKTTKDSTMSYMFNGEEIKVETCGVKVAIIDFTLSRLHKDGCTLFCDLSLDPTLFIGQGDYQFDIYRMMKDENKNEWKSFHPYTNVLWLHYLADKLIKATTYPNATSREHKALARAFRTFLRDALDYGSAGHLVTQCPFFTESA